MMPKIRSQSDYTSTEDVNVMLLKTLSTLTEVMENMQEDQKTLAEELRCLSESKDDDKEEEDNEGSMERNTVRLDGIEVYAVVAALTVASSIACLDTFSGNRSSDFEFHQEIDKILSTTEGIAFSISIAVGILTGLHATLVFSLATMYGRTAVGLGRDDAFHDFFQNTGLQRYRAFQTFLWSLYAFMVQVAIIIVDLMVPDRRLITKMAAYGIIGYFVYKIYRETRDIIDKAGVIFAPPKPKVKKTRDVQKSFRDHFAKQRNMSFRDGSAIAAATIENSDDDSDSPPTSPKNKEVDLRQKSVRFVEVDDAENKKED